MAQLGPAVNGLQLQRFLVLASNSRDLRRFVVLYRDDGGSLHEAFHTLGVHFFRVVLLTLPGRSPAMGRRQGTEGGY